MKKILLLLFVTLLVVSACSTEETTNDPGNDQQNQQDENNQDNETNGENNDDKSQNPTLTKEEAEEILIEYENTFKVERNNDGEVKQFKTKEELFNHYTSVMSEDLANSHIETYFKEENGQLSIIPMDAPTWLETNQSFELKQQSETKYQVTQERSNQLIGHVQMIYTLSYQGDHWIVKGIDKKDLGNESQHAAEELVRNHLNISNSQDTQVKFDHKENGLYVVHVFDVDGEGKSSHITTRGWYKVDPETNEIRNMMDQNEDIVIDFKDIAQEIVETVANKDMRKLAGFVHSEKGLLLSPNVYVEEDAVTFDQETVKNLLNNENVYTWGVQDGSGKPIKSTPEEYFDRFQGFKHPDEILVDNIKQRGTLRNNIKEVFPDSHVVEFYNKGTAGSNMDWSSLYIVMEKNDNNIWKLVALVNGQWTI